MKDSYLLTRLVRRTLLVTSVFVLLIFLTLSFFFFWESKNRLQEKLTTDLQGMSEALSQYYVVGDLVGLRNYLDNLSENYNWYGEIEDKRSEIVWRRAIPKSVEPRKFITSVTPLEYAINKPFGTLRISQDVSRDLQNTFYLIIVLGVLIVTSFVVFGLTQMFVLRGGLRPMFQLRNDLLYEAQRLGVEHRNSLNDELEVIRDCFSRISLGWTNERKLVAEKSREAAIAMTARQVAHDIRSPLSALTMLSEDLKSLPARKFQLVQSALNRIQNIANDLLEKSKSASSQIPEAQIQPQNLSLLMSQIEEEVLLRHGDNANFKFVNSELEESVPAFNTEDFNRVLINLITNAVESYDLQMGNPQCLGSGNLSIVRSESFPTGNGHPRERSVWISSIGKKDHIEVKITDKGPGIPCEVLQSIGKKTITLGKGRKGNGLGLFHAKRTLESYGGKLTIESSPHAGTTLTLNWPLKDQSQPL